MSIPFASFQPFKSFLTFEMIFETIFLLALTLNIFGPPIILGGEEWTDSLLQTAVAPAEFLFAGKTGTAGPLGKNP